MRLAASRADCTAGRVTAIKIAMILLTTSSSTRVKAAGGQCRASLVLELDMASMPADKRTSPEGRFYCTWMPNGHQIGVRNFEWLRIRIILRK